MAALTAERDTKDRGVSWGTLHEFTATDSTQYWQGGMVAIDPATGLLIPAAIDDNTLVVTGRCEESVLTGASTTRKIKVRSGVFNWASAGIDANDRGKQVYIADDQTVTLTAGDDASAGTIYDFDSDGCWVNMPWPIPGA